MVSTWCYCLLNQYCVRYLQPFGVPPKLSSSLNIAKSIAAGMATEVRDDVAVSSPLAALTMTKETSKTGRACLFILVVWPMLLSVFTSRSLGEFEIKLESRTF